MDGYLSNKPKIFLGDPEKLYRKRRCEAQHRKRGLVDPKGETKESSFTPRATPPREVPTPPPLNTMGEQLGPQLEHTIGELFVPDINELPILNLDNVGEPFEIKIPTLRMVQNLPFSGKEDANLHIQAFTQLCRTFNMEDVSQDQMRTRLFPFSLEGKAL